MSTILSGPMFEPRKHGGFRKITEGDGGAHYSVWHLDSDFRSMVDPEVGMESLRAMFPTPETANAENFVLFSTSGIHGTYITIEEIEEGLCRYGVDFDPGEDEPEHWCGNTLTVLVVQPRIVCLRCGEVRVRTADVPYLKALRESSLAAASMIGR